MDKQLITGIYHNFLFVYWHFFGKNYAILFFLQHFTFDWQSEYCTKDLIVLINGILNQLMG